MRQTVVATASGLNPPVPWLMKQTRLLVHTFGTSVTTKFQTFATFYHHGSGIFSISLAFQESRLVNLCWPPSGIYDACLDPFVTESILLHPAEPSIEQCLALIDPDGLQKTCLAPF